MGRTAPAPDIPPTPGMCPHVVVKAGGSQSGGSGGKGAGSGGGGSGGAPGGDGDGAGGGDPGAASGSPDGKKYEKAGKESEPVDPATGRVYTDPVCDLFLPGPLNFRFARVYSTHLAHRNVGLGWGWTHSYAWRLEERRRGLFRVWGDSGVWVELPRMPDDADEITGPYGWLLRRTSQGLVLDCEDGVFRHFASALDANGEHQLMEVRDKNNNNVSLSYDEHGRLVGATDCVGRRVRFAIGDNGLIAAVEAYDDSAQQWLRFAHFSYGSRGELLTASDAAGHAHRFAYDERNRLTSNTNRNGLCFRYRYDRSGRCAEAWGEYVDGNDPALAAAVPPLLADGKTRAKGIHHVRLDYLAEGLVDVITSRAVKTFTPNALGTMDMIVDAGAVLSAEYDVHGHLLSETDALGATTTYERDARGRPVKITDPLGRTVAIERDKWGHASRLIDAGGGVRTIERDSRANVVRVTDQAGGSWYYERNERGQVVSMAGATGAVSRLAMDAHGNVTGVTRPDGSHLTRSYDFWGRAVSDTDPTGEHKYWYSVRGELIAEQAPNGATSRYEYDGEEQLVAIHLPNGGTERLVHGGYGRLAGYVDATGREMRMRYGREGELLEVQRPDGRRHCLEYDERLFVVAEETFDGRKFRHRYDAMGRIVRVTDGASESTTLSYDAAGQMVQRELSDGAVESFRYDANGNLCGAAGPGGEFSMVFDSLGRVLEESQVVAGDVQTVTHEYDVAGGRVAIKTSLGTDIGFKRDVFGAVVESMLNGATIRHDRDGLAREARRELPGGAALMSTYEPSGRLAERRIDGDSAPGYRYRYDAEGQLLEWSNSAGAGYTSEYDLAGRLTSSKAHGAAQPEVWRYDATGNLLSDDGSRVYDDRGRLTSCLGASYRWDDRGRLVEKTRGAERWSYEWGSHGLLSRTVSPNGTSCRFSYDPLARRTRKQVFVGDEQVQDTRYLYDQRRCIQEVVEAADDHGTRLRTYLFEDGGVVPYAHELARVGTGPVERTRAHYLCDPAGRPACLVDDAGAVVEVIHDHGWHPATTLDDAKDTTPIRGQGQWHDTETGLHYNRYRYYDPVGAIFLSPDPLRLHAPGYNPYRASCCPFSWVDVLGLANMPPSVVDSRRAAAARGDRATREAIAAARKQHEPNEGYCAQSSRAVIGAKKPNGEPLFPGAKEITMSDPKGSEVPLDTWDDVKTYNDGEPWGSHTAVVLPDGRVIDPDQNMVFNNKEDWKKATVEGPATFDTWP